MKKILSGILTVLLVVSSACIPGYADMPQGEQLVLMGNQAMLNGAAVAEFDYTWHCDPSIDHNEVKNAPAEYYTGTKPDTEAAVYIDHELYYFPQLPQSGFQLQRYDGENEWGYHYTDGVHDEYLFATLPNLGNQLPTQMMHTPQEAAANKVLHITKPGTYLLEGTWNGQIWVDLGEDASTDPGARVTLVLNGVDITCTVAPGVVFYRAYECDNAWEERDSWSADVDTSDAGVNVILAAGTRNSVSGTNVFRMLKPVYKDEGTGLQKKLRKTDAAFYSYVSMNFSGEGALDITSGYEGLDSELHMTILGGEITINSQDDGINVNEDHVSVVSFNGGNVTIHPAQGAEGDGVDSNGFITLRGGTVSVNGVRVPDSALDSEDGVYYSSGTVILDGVEQSYTPGSVLSETGGRGGQRPGNPGGGNFDLASFKAAVAALDDNATLEDVLALLGMNAFRPMGDRMDRSSGMFPPQGGRP